MLDFTDGSVPIQEIMGSVDGLGRSHMPQSSQAHVLQLLSLCSEVQEPQLLIPCAATPGARMP